MQDQRRECGLEFQDGSRELSPAFARELDTVVQPSHFGQVWLPDLQGSLGEVGPRGRNRPFAGAGRGLGRMAGDAPCPPDEAAVQAPLVLLPRTRPFGWTPEREGGCTTEDSGSSGEDVAGMERHCWSCPPKPGHGQAEELVCQASGGEDHAVTGGGQLHRGS
eukprot:5703038-Lingulodinium_polyedra.AAC.1